MKALLPMLSLAVVFYIIRYFAITRLQAKITFFDVGQGDSALIQTINGKKILIDGGPKGALDDKLVDMFVTNHCHIDVILVTHPHSDHISGLTRVFDRCTVGKIYYNNVVCSTEVCDRLKKKILEIDHSHIYRGQRILVEEVALYVLWPSEELVMQEYSDNLNDYSVVLLMDSGKFEAFFTGDAEKDILDQVNLNYVSQFIDGNVEVLKVSHHGSQDAFNRNFIENVAPDISVFSVGKNTFGHPDSEVLKYQNTLGSKIYRTDEMGDINIVIGGE